MVLHLWQATQIVIDVAMSACLALRLGTPNSYADVFRRLRQAGIIEADLAERRAAGYRNLVAHAYESLDLRRVHQAASDGPAHLLRFLAVLRDHAAPRRNRNPLRADTTFVGLDDKLPTREQSRARRLPARGRTTSDRIA